MKSLKTNSNSMQEGTIILLATAIITKIIGALFKIPLSSDNCLGDLGFGYFSASYDILTPVTTLALSGFPVAVSHLISQYALNKKYSELGQVVKILKKFFLYFGICALLLFLLLIFPLVKITDRTGNTLYGLIAILPSVLICGVISLYRGYFEGFLNMRPAAISNLIEALCKLVLGYTFALITVKTTGNLALSAAAALFGITLGMVFATIYIYIKYKKHSKNYDFCQEPIQNFDSKGLIKIILLLSITMAAASLSTSIVSFVDSLTIRNTLAKVISVNTEFFKERYKDLLTDNSLSELPTVFYGIKSKAFTLFNILITLILAIGVSVVPNLSNSESDKKTVDNNINLSLKLTCLIAAPVSFGFIFLGKEIMTLIFGIGSSANIGGNILMIYGFAAVFAAFSIILTFILQSFKCYKFVLFSIFVASIIKFILNIILTNILTLNIYGNAIATFGFYFIIFLLSIILFTKKNGILSLKGIFLKPIVSGIITCGFAYLLVSIYPTKIMIFIAISVAAILYFAMILLTKYIKIQEFLTFNSNKK